MEGAELSIVVELRRITELLLSPPPPPEELMVRALVSLEMIEPEEQVPTVAAAELASLPEIVAAVEYTAE